MLTDQRLKIGVKISLPKEKVGDAGPLRRDKAGILHQPVQIKALILIDKKTGLTVVPALYDVQRDSCGYDSWSSRHVIRTQTKPGRMHRGLFCCVAVWLVEDMLADLDRLDVFRGPTGGCFTLVEI